LVGFSKVTLLHLVKHLFLLHSLAESSDDAARLPFKVLDPPQLGTLVNLSVTASPSIQMLVQKIF
jgi:hypothetical protein